MLVFHCLEVAISVEDAAKMSYNPHPSVLAVTNSRDEPSYLVAVESEI